MVLFSTFPFVMTNIFFILLVLLFTSCVPIGKKSKLSFTPESLPQVEAVIPENVSYEFLKKEILTPHCIKCHDRMGTEAGLAWWLVPGVVEESELFLAMEDGSMPPGRAATTRELEIVRRYVEQLKPRAVKPPRLEAEFVR